MSKPVISKRKSQLKLRTLKNARFLTTSQWNSENFLISEKYNPEGYKQVYRIYKTIKKKFPNSFNPLSLSIWKDSKQISIQFKQNNKLDLLAKNTYNIQYTVSTNTNPNTGKIYIVLDLLKAEKFDEVVQELKLLEDCYFSSDDEEPKENSGYSDEENTPPVRKGFILADPHPSPTPEQIKGFLKDKTRMERHNSMYMPTLLEEDD
jgi:hypothetical protein